MAAGMVVAMGLGKLTLKWGKNGNKIIEMPCGYCNFRVRLPAALQ